MLNKLDFDYFRIWGAGGSGVGCLKFYFGDGDGVYETWGA